MAKQFDTENPFYPNPKACLPDRQGQGFSGFLVVQ
jgi:hypothetical protein